MIFRQASYTSYASGYAGNQHGYVSYAVTHAFPSPHTCGRARGEHHCFSRERYKTMRNRVTHVTTVILGVTNA